MIGCTHRRGRSPLHRVAAVGLSLFLLVSCSADPVTARLADDPAAQALRAADRAAFAALEAHMRASAPGDDGSTDAFEARLHAYVRTSIVPAYVLLASDAAIAEHVAVTTMELEELRDRSYRRCHAFLYGDASSTLGPLQLAGAIPAGTRLARSRATARLIESAGSAEATAEASAVHAALDRSVLPQLPHRYRDRVVRVHDADVRMLDAVTACDVTIDMYRIVGALPGPDGPLLRRHFATRDAAPAAE